MSRSSTTVSDSTPVDSYNSNTINPFEVPEAPSKGRDVGTSVTTETKAKSVNLQYRAAHAALMEIHHETHLSQVSFITINFDQRTSRVLVSEGGAPAYGKKLSRRFKNKLTTGKQKLLQKPQMFLSFEDSEDGSQHVHIIMRHHPDDKDLLNVLLRKDAAKHDNAVQFKTEYQLWFDAEPGSELWELNELELEYDRAYGTDLCMYPEVGFNRHGQERCFRWMPVDTGAADYISKELNNPLEGNPAASRKYIDSELKSRAKEIIEERYEFRRDLKREMPEIESIYKQASSSLQEAE